jgi:hypothetical protein
METFVLGNKTNTSALRHLAALPCLLSVIAGGRLQRIRLFPTFRQACDAADHEPARRTHRPSCSPPPLCRLCRQSRSGCSTRLPDAIRGPPVASATRLWPNCATASPARDGRRDPNPVIDHPRPGRRILSRVRGRTDCRSVAAAVLVPSGPHCWRHRDGHRVRRGRHPEYGLLEAEVAADAGEKPATLDELQEAAAQAASEAYEFDCSVIESNRARMMPRLEKRRMHEVTYRDAIDQIFLLFNGVAHFIGVPLAVTVLGPHLRTGIDHHLE